MCCAVVGGDAREGSAGSGGGALSAFCSGACGAEHLQESGGPTEGQTVAERGLGLELVRDRETKTQKNNELHVSTQTKINTY